MLSEQIVGVNNKKGISLAGEAYILSKISKWVYYGAIHNEDLQAARDFLLEEFNVGLIKSQSQRVRVLVIED